MTRDEAKDEVRRRFHLADGALQYGNVHEAIWQLQRALEHCHEDVQEPTWWQGNQSDLFVFMKYECPALLRHYQRWLIGMAST